MDSAVYFNVASAALFVFGSIALINSDSGWQTFSGGLFLAGSMTALTVYLTQQKKEKLSSTSPAGHVFFLVGAFLNIIYGHMLSSVILYLIGSILFLCDDILFKFKSWEKFFSSFCFCFGSLFLFQAIIPTTVVAGIFFAVGSFFLLYWNVLNIDKEFQVDIFSAVGLFVVIELLFVLDINIDALYDDRVNTSINYVAFLALLIGILSNFPQIVHTYYTESVDNFSNWSLIFWFFSALSWAVFALVSKTYLLLANNIVSFITVTVIIFYKIREGKFTFTGYLE